MKFGQTDRSVGQSYPSDAFPFPPPALAMDTDQAFALPNAGADGDGLDVRELGKDREIHTSNLGDPSQSV